MIDKVQKIREEIERLKLCTMDEHMKFYSEAAEAEYNALCKVEEIIDSLQEEPVKIKKGCKYRSICNVTNNDTRNISFVAGKIYLAPEDDTLVSEENGWLCDTSEDASNFELVEEPISEELLNTAAREWICDHKEGERLFVKDAFIAGVKWILEQQKNKNYGKQVENKK